MTITDITGFTGFLQPLQVQLQILQVQLQILQVLCRNATVQVLQICKDVKTQLQILQVPVDLCKIPTVQVLQVLQTCNSY